MADAGIADVFIANEVVAPPTSWPAWPPSPPGRGDRRRRRRVGRRGAGAKGRAGSVVDVLVDIDIGLGRRGVLHPPTPPPSPGSSRASGGCAWPGSWATRGA